MGIILIICLIVLFWPSDKKTKDIEDRVKKLEEDK